MEQKQKKIIFICTANLCRSPFAEYYFNKHKDQYSLSSFSASSMGVRAMSNIASPLNLVKIAEEFDVDIKPHRSKPLDEAQLVAADVIIAMEPFHQVAIAELFPRVEEKIFLMRSFAESGSKKRGVVDPINLSDEFVQACYDDISEAINGMFTTLIR